jgi:hypothetical protein
MGEEEGPIVPVDLEKLSLSSTCNGEARRGTHAASVKNLEVGLIPLILRLGSYCSATCACREIDHWEKVYGEACRMACIGCINVKKILRKTS